MSARTIASLCFAWVIGLGVGPGAARAAAPWEGPAFSAAPGTLHQAATQVAAPDDADVLVLLREGHVRLAADGRATLTLRPVFRSGGVTEGFVLVPGAAVHLTRFVIEAPQSLPLRHALRQLPGATLRRSVKDGVVRLELVHGPLAPRQALEPFTPGEIFQTPQLAYATGASWQQVAQRYGEFVEQQLADAPLKELLAQHGGGVREPEALAARLLGWLQREVRYTGLELGQSSIVPHKPQDVLARKYGDCKDMAMLLVGLLRAAGVPARVALLRAGGGPDVVTALPGIGMFNHAIVYLPPAGRRPALWIDPTFPLSRPGQLSPEAQGRLALIIAPET